MARNAAADSPADPPADPPAVPAFGYGLIVLITLFWGVNFPAMKITLGEITPWYYRSYCLLVGGIGLLAVTRAMGYRLAVPADQLRPLLITAVFNVTGWQLLTAYGLTMVEASKAIIVVYTMPVWAALLARVVLNEPITAARVAGLALGLSGIAVLGDIDFLALSATPLGVVLLLAAALCWAIATVCMKYFHWTMPVTQTVG